MSTPDQQIALLTEKLNTIEIESRRLLTALNWASKVRMILVGCLLLFMAVSVFMFYRLYVDVRTNRIAEVQRIINENPEEFAEPLTRQVMLLAEEQGPYVIEKFREQAQQDSDLFLNAFDAERTLLIANLQANLETKLRDSYAAMLTDQEEMLKTEFPVLQDPDKLENIRSNMEKIYDKIGKRYLVDSLKEEMERIASKVDTFPPSEPKQDNIPLGEQIATELLELVRLMVVNTENYAIPTEGQAISASAASIGTTSGPTPVDVSLDDEGQEKPAAKDDEALKAGDDKSADGDKSASDENSGEEAKSATDGESTAPDKSGAESQTGEKEKSNSTEKGSLPN